jgi:uncharacterized repeat protein (TIGR03803 family)
MPMSVTHRSKISGLNPRALALALSLATAVVWTPSAQAQTFSVLYYFAGGGTDGIAPYGPLIESNGILYGTTEGGGGTNGRSYGTVFKLDLQTQTETVLYSFGSYQSDGDYPTSGVIRDTAGNLYGTTDSGGTHHAPGGTVFKISSNGTESLLHSFANTAQIVGGLVQDAAGNLYGTTEEGGTFHRGTVFRIDKIGRYAILYSFTGGTDGQYPRFDNLILDRRGNLYGTTTDGGAFGFGTVFKLNIKTRVETVLHSFATTEGFEPYAGLIRDSSGNLYGTTARSYQGPNCGSSLCGAVFKLDKVGAETVLYSFTGPDGAYPIGALVRDAAGNLYGTTEVGGNLSDCSSSNGPGCGVVFKIDPSGKETVLYSFTGGADGKYPTSSLVLDSAGNLYGTTIMGGTGCNGNGCGVLFRVIP